ncbi:hypothetical protein PPYR_10368 [Photinus pyralis]|uniref:Uncharacterized protein n=1 Tax=Photinus pyralis TaxID=7054 RepID=A0A1Y1LJP9_PHOPY|nr:uncharacterized protein LOC116173952 [Photinus pyralis]KAB0796307.1 hypothetical protein PPYR_10368 [Photinus pyralis]
MMTNCFKVILLLYHLLQFSASGNVRVTFEKCEWKGFTCKSSIELPERIDVTFQCNSTVTGQDIEIYIWSFNAPNTIASLTIQDCEKVHLHFACGDNKAIQWLKVRNVETLEIMQPTVTQNPRKVYFENITSIATLPADSFSQMKNLRYRPSCGFATNELEGIYFKNVFIGNIETAAFRNLSDIREFEWINVAVDKISYAALNIRFADDGVGSITNCSFGILEPLAFQVTADQFSVRGTTIKDLWPSGLNGTSGNFVFTNNTVNNMQSGSIAMLCQTVLIKFNYFKNVESGAFGKISPGLLHDSQTHFGKLQFVYDFKSNTIAHVEDKGIRPDIETYRNVASYLNYTENFLQCSCESLSWYGADINLGFGYSVLKDFNMMILNPQNKNNCNFRPCMCFTGSAPENASATLIPAVF